MSRPVQVAGIMSDNHSINLYLSNIKNKFNPEIIGVKCLWSPKEGIAEFFSEQYDIPVAGSYEEILSDPEIGIVLINTSLAEHFSYAERALEAGKNVYTDKPLCAEIEDARKLSALAQEKGLLLGSSPDSFMSAACQTIRKQLDDGAIGEVTSFDVHSSRGTAYLAGFITHLLDPYNGIVRDYAPYHITQLVNLFGPVRRVFGMVRFPEKEIKDRIRAGETGEKTPYTDYELNEKIAVAILEMESGVLGTIHFNGCGCNDYSDGGFAFYGTKGILKMGEPNIWNSPVSIIPESESYVLEKGRETLIPLPEKYADNDFGCGITDMAVSVREKGRPFRANDKLAVHVLDVLTSILESAQTGKPVEVKSTCERPAAFLDEDLFR